MKFQLILSYGRYIAVIAAISLVSCKKDITTNNSNSKATILSDSSTLAENAYNDVLSNAFVSYSDNAAVMDISQSKTGKTTTFSTGTEEVVGTAHLSCATYTVSDSTPGKYPKTITLDFGTGCASLDGVTRSGQISYEFSAPLFTTGAIITATFNQYSVNGYTILGAYTITNNSDQSGISFNTVVTNGIITYPDLTNYHYSHNKTYKQSAGASTPFDFTDDAYSITGNSAFSAPDGSTLVFNTSTPLLRTFTCPNITQGIVAFVYDNAVNGTIDFGDGTCDNSAVIKVGNISQTISLR